MPTADLSELIAKLEAATEPSRELDSAIGQTIGMVAYDRSTDVLGYPVGDDAPYPAFTTSLDAALTLVPGGAFWRVGHDGEGPNPADFRADVLNVMPAERRSVTGKGVAGTPALALCIAALRARTKEQSHDR